MFSRIFIDRPIFAAVLSIVITLGGLVAYWTLPIAQYPEIAPPTVQVFCVYPGASAKVVADTVAAPIEQQVNGVENMLYMSSQCTNDGVYTLTVTFALGTDLNIAQVLVQNRVQLAMPVIPDVVQLQGVAVLNINELANSLKPIVLPGEIMRVFILKEGKEYNQGVAYLDDGTMVVIDNARKMIGKTIDISVTSVLQTTAGKMIFGKWDERGGHRGSPSPPPVAGPSATATSGSPSDPAKKPTPPADRAAD